MCDYKSGTIHFDSNELRYCLYLNESSKVVDLHCGDTLELYFPCENIWIPAHIEADMQGRYYAEGSDFVYYSLNKHMARIYA